MTLSEGWILDLSASCPGFPTDISADLWLGSGELCARRNPWRWLSPNQLEQGREWLVMIKESDMASDCLGLPLLI